MFVKNRFCHFRTFPWLLKKICKIKTNLSEIRKASPPPPSSTDELLPLFMFCNIHRFGITKRKVMGSYAHKTKRKVTLTKLQVTLTKLQVKAAFHSRVFHTYVYARKTLNRRKH